LNIVQLCKILILKFFPSFVALVIVKQYLEFVITVDHRSPLCRDTHFLSGERAFHGSGKLQIRQIINNNKVDINTIKCIIKYEIVDVYIIAMEANDQYSVKIL